MDLSKTIIHNVRYGNGHITKIDKDLVWVLFENVENEICFHLLSAFTGEAPFLKTDDEELNSFLFSLGCYSGESITVISHINGGCVIVIKDARYSIDKELAKAILV